MPYTVLDVDSHSQQVAQHLRRVDEGTYRLPEFQRTFVWDQDRILRLWDSLYRGFPVGQLMLWEPVDIDFPMRGLGRQQAEVQGAAGVNAVIDGQQRLTALYLVLMGDTRGHPASIRSGQSEIHLYRRPEHSSYGHPPLCRGESRSIR